MNREGHGVCTVFSSSILDRARVGVLSVSLGLRRFCGERSEIGASVQHVATNAAYNRSRLAESGGRPVRRRLLLQVPLLLAVGVLLSSCGCGLCNPRHGMILRGDWSLELNRVPWLNSRTQSYDEVGEESCGPGMPLRPPISPEGCVGASGVPVAGPSPVAHTCPRGGLMCRTCARSNSATSAPSPQQVAHSRFHPVPTRPVFTPWNCPVPDPETGAPQKLQPVQEQPQSEVIPTPAASQSAMKPTRASGSVTSASWVFQP
jgi:hypothetical protein